MDKDGSIAPPGSSRQSSFTRSPLNLPINGVYPPQASMSEDASGQSMDNAKRTTVGAVPKIFGLPLKYVSLVDLSMLEAKQAEKLSVSMLDWSPWPSRIRLWSLLCIILASPCRRTARYTRQPQLSYWLKYLNAESRLLSRSCGQNPRHPQQEGATSFQLLQHYPPIDDNHIRHSRVCNPVIIKHDYKVLFPR